MPAELPIRERSEASRARRHTPRPPGAGDADGLHVNDGTSTQNHP